MLTAEQSRALASVVKVGDRLIPDPLWNRTTRDRLPDVVTVLAVRLKRVCQSGALVQVAFEDGELGWLDVGWFRGAET